MKTAYAPDNTRSSVVVVLSMAFAAVLIAALIGLSDKPDVDTIAIAASSDVIAPAAGSGGATFDFDAGTDQGVAPSEQAGADGGPAVTFGDDEPEDPTDPGAAGTDDTAPETASDATERAQSAIPIPPAEPTPTPEVEAAVAPTPMPESAEAESSDALDTLTAPGLPASSGSVQGQFFTRPDEDEGAVVSQNLVTVSFAEDGSGDFQGVLDITYPDGTRILMNMSGPLTWTPTTPQVKATLSGAYTFDAPIDADDVSSDDAELSITSLESGSGSLCTPKCFGFTFPPQGGF